MSLLDALIIVSPILFIASLVTLARALHLRLFLSHFKMTYKDAPALTFLFFSVFALIIGLRFPDHVAYLFREVHVLGYIGLLFLFLVIFPVVYRKLRKDDGVPAWLVTAFPDEQMLSLEERYILAKIADVTFQDFAAGVLVLVLSGMGVSYPLIVGIFVLLFASAHFYIFRTSGFFWGLYYSTYAALGGFAIPFLILFVPAGIVYVLILHMLFYVLSAAFFASLPRPSTAVMRHIVGAEPV